MNKEIELTEVQVKEMEIELLKAKLRYIEVENDKLTKQLNLGVVSHRRELLINFFDYLVKYGLIQEYAINTKEKIVDRAQEIII